MILPRRYSDFDCAPHHWELPGRPKTPEEPASTRPDSSLVEWESSATPRRVPPRSTSGGAPEIKVPWCGRAAGVLPGGASQRPGSNPGQAIRTTAKPSRHVRPRGDRYGTTVPKGGHHLQAAGHLQTGFDSPRGAWTIATAVPHVPSGAAGRRRRGCPAPPLYRSSTIHRRRGSRSRCRTRPLCQRGSSRTWSDRFPHSGAAVAMVRPIHGGTPPGAVIDSGRACGGSTPPVGTQAYSSLATQRSQCTGSSPRTYHSTDSCSPVGQITPNTMSMDDSSGRTEHPKHDVNG